MRGRKFCEACRISNPVAASPGLLHIMAVDFPRLFAADETLLLRALAHHIDDAMLREIAAADYGCDEDSHFSVLRPMRDEGFVPAPRFAASEVLELVRWSQPDCPSWKPGGYGSRGHRMRAFCCAWLLRIEGDPASIILGDTSVTLAHLIVSIDSAAADLWNEAGAFLTWCVDTSAAKGSGFEDAFLGVALLRCGLESGDIADDTLSDLCRWTIAREQAQPSAFSMDNTWLHRSDADPGRDAWTKIGRHMATMDVRSRSAELQEWVGLISAMLVGE
ncbi:MAG: hypothetical protein ABI240_05915 [Sphingomonas sp.]